MRFSDLIEIVLTIGFVALCVVTLIVGLVRLVGGHIDGLLYLLTAFIALRQK